VKKKKKQEKQKISTTPILIEHNGRVYLGCDRCNQRMEVSICDSRRCSKRKKCPIYLQAKDMKQEWLEEHPQVLVVPVRKRKRKRTVTEEVSMKKRTRKRKPQETPVKRKRKLKETEQPIKRKRVRKSETKKRRRRRDG
jgi:hypothetical protein